MRTYAVVFQKTQTGWCAYYPDFPGLASCADTFEELKALTLEGLEFHIEAMLKNGDSVPAPKFNAEYVDMPVPDSIVSAENVDHVRAA